MFLLRLLFVLAAYFSQAKPQGGCPPQETILPCRCLTRGIEIQVWCSHTNLPKIREGLAAVGQYLRDPIDELILENNHLPSLPGRAFAPLRILRLMLRYNRLERVTSDWLSGLEDSLVELFVVEPELRSLPDDSLERLDSVQAVTIQSSLIKRLPRMSALPKLRYVKVESSSLLELSPRLFKSLPSLEKLHVVGSPRLARLESGILQDLPKLSLVNVSHCGISFLHPRAIAHLRSLKELWLVGNKITDAAMIGRGIRDLPALENLYLNQNAIDKISEAAFVDLPSLKKLFMANNRITELHHGAFHRVPKLKMLDLNRNLLRRVHPESFLQHSGSGLQELWLMENAISHVAELRSLLETLPRLTFLDMSNNNLEEIPFGSIRGHPTLERLHLDHNKIRFVDREAFTAMPALTELRLRNNSLTNMLPAPLWNLPALKGLDLSGNYFRRLEPRLLANLPSLRKLDLSENEIDLVDPTSFLDTPMLENVNLSANLISSTHATTFRNLRGLFELDLSNNRMQEFVGGLPRGIEYLHLSGNKIGKIPPQPSPDLDLPALKMLDLNDNRIQRLPGNGVKTLVKLKKLYLAENSLKVLGDGSLDGLSHLEVLDFHQNRITQVHPDALKHVVALQHLNLGSNRLTSLPPDIFRNIPQLRTLDVSQNQLAKLASEALEATRNLEAMNASHNSLIQLPSSLHGLERLQKLDVTGNRLSSVQPETLNSLTSLIDLRMSQNLIKTLKKGSFDGIPKLSYLSLDDNEIEGIESNAIQGMPMLKEVRLGKNGLRQVPGDTFNNLPSLETVELQQNRIQRIAGNAFGGVPQLLMLNLSSNRLASLEQAGLRGVRSLEMLDLSKNRLSSVTAPALQKMDWLVELRMDNNQICNVRGSPFGEMPRLRVLSLRNNKMMSFPENAVRKLRGNLNVLDIDGNPLDCSCNLLWFRAWLHESASIGPKCLDGGLLRDMRISRRECEEQEPQSDPVAPGCESELLSAPEKYITSQVFAPWMDMKMKNSTKHMETNKIAPSPEESDYFDDEYIDYPYNDTLANKTKQPQKSSHYVTGDTPTLYAGASKDKTEEDANSNVPKELSSSPSSSGFTFFGVPLPSFNLDLFGAGGTKGRMTDKEQQAPLQTADRKTAIMNHRPPQRLPTNFPSPIRQSGKISVPTRPAPPTKPKIETGGFLPMLPGEGGFNPIARPENQDPGLKRVVKGTVTKYNTTLAVTAVPEREPSIPVPRVPKPTMAMPPSAAVKDISMVPEKTHLQAKLEIQPSIQTDVDSAEATSPQTSADEGTVTTEVVAVDKENITEASIDDRFETIFKEVVDNVPIPVPSSLDHVLEDKLEGKPEPAPTRKTLIVMGEVVTETTQPALLVPGGQQPQIRTHQGKSSITRVSSPHIAAATSPLLSGGDEENPVLKNVGAPMAHNREPKTSASEGRPGNTQNVEAKSDDLTWYYVNYNNTNLEPYIGPGGRYMADSSRVLRGSSMLIIIIGIVTIFYRFMCL